MRILILAGLVGLMCASHGRADELSGPVEPAKAGAAEPTPPRSGWQVYTEPVKDLVQIVFWLTVSVVTVLTYRRARKTLLQPIRTEVFKLQVEEVKQLFKIVIGKGETELRHYFGFDELINANAIALLDDYAYIRLGMKIDYDKRPYFHTSGKMISSAAPGFRFHRMDGPGIPVELLKQEPDTRTPDERWAEYYFGVIHLMPTYVKRSKRLEQFLESPMLPIECVELVRSLRDNLQKNVSVIFDVLTKTAKELPKHFPTEKEMQRADVMWVGNHYSDAFTPLKPDADKIVSFIRKHFGVDQLLKDA